MSELVHLARLVYCSRWGVYGSPTHPPFLLVGGFVSTHPPCLIWVLQLMLLFILSPRVLSISPPLGLQPCVAFLLMISWFAAHTIAGAVALLGELPCIEAIICETPTTAKPELWACTNLAYILHSALFVSRCDALSTRGNLHTF